MLALSRREFHSDPPYSVWINNEKVANHDDWRDALVRATSDSWVRWDEEERWQRRLDVSPQSDCVTVSLPLSFQTDADGVSIVEPFPFEVCALAPLFREEWVSAGYRQWGFGRRHVDHGWGCGFRGAGHDRLVSRRWLDFGPWRVIRRPNDTTFIQFHDLSITDPAEAYAQAKVGHQRMGVDPIGGFIQGIDPKVTAEVNGLYRAEARTLEIIVPPGTEVTQQEMRVVCGLRLQHRLAPPALDPVDDIAYVFIDKADAKAHLHELWLRELQCWYVDERGRHRIDVDYQPVPDPPAWVRALDAR